MATSQNGYKANDRSLVASYSVPGGKLAMRKGDVATVLSYVTNRFHSEVEKLVWPGNWGYAERTIRGNSTTLSNHASGTAIDLNAPRHPLGKVGTFSAAQKGRIRKILNDCEGVVRWGGDYNGRKDEMHFEINKGTAAVKSLANKIKAGKKPGPSGGATSGGSSGGSSSNPTYTQIYKGALLRTYVKGTPVKDVQKQLGLKADGYYGDATKAAVVKFQKSKGLGADGIVGDATWAALKKAGMKPSPSDRPAKPKAPAFPLPKGHWYGPESKNSKNHSGFYAKDRPGIKQIQKKLGLAADGLYGAKTYAAVSAFQRKNKLTVDGGVGSATWGKLF